MSLLTHHTLLFRLAPWGEATGSILGAGGRSDGKHRPGSRLSRSGAASRWRRPLKRSFTDTRTQLPEPGEPAEPPRALTAQLPASPGIPTQGSRGQESTQPSGSCPGWPLPGWKRLPEEAEPPVRSVFRSEYGLRCFRKTISCPCFPNIPLWLRTLIFFPPHIFIVDRLFFKLQK